jgi:hypothetical protein
MHSVRRWGGEEGFLSLGWGGGGAVIAAWREKGLLF